MKNKLFGLVCAGTTLLSLFLTAEHFRVLPFSPIQRAKHPYVKEEKGIYVSSMPYSSEESTLYLGRDLLSKGYQPVQITIQNNSPKTLILNLEELENRQIPSHTVAKTVFKSALPRSIGLKIASLFFWPLAIPSAIDSVNTFHTYRSAKQDYLAKELREESISPYSTVNRVLFMHTQDVHSKLPLKLIDKHTGKEIPIYG